MIEHPVPQNVTGYQFHLVGDMTLKQFLELAGGVFAPAVAASGCGFPLEIRKLSHKF